MTEPPYIQQMTRLYNTFCNSGFVDEVTLSHTGFIVNSKPKIQGLAPYFSSAKISGLK